MAVLLRFVNSIQNVPTAFLDLNDGVTWSTLNETDLGMPAMRRTVTSSMLRDGEYVGATAYGNRELNLVLNLLTSSANAAAAQLQLLQRELDRPTNLLQYLPDGAANTVFFRTFRSSASNIQFDAILKQVRVTLLAEPFALGVREDLAAITVRNDPTLANGLFCDLTGIKGDVEAPLFIEYADGAGGLARPGFSIGVRSGPAPYPNWFIQAESMTQNSDTSVVADAAFSGGSKSRCTFATVLDGGRLSSIFPSPTVPAGAENWGVYRVFARVAQTVAADVITMYAGLGLGANNKPVTIRSQTNPQLVDLGTMDSTYGLSTIGGYAATDYRIEGSQVSMKIMANRVSGTGSLDIDYVAFVPADECLGSWDGFSNVVATTDLGVIDGPNDSAYVATALTGATPGRQAVNSASIYGRLPRVMPGNNRLVIVESSRFPSGSANALTTSIAMTIRYWPRYLLVRPVST